MSFTDEDLKRLKDDASRTLSGVYLTKEKILILLARLEAAEQALRSRTFSDSVMEQEADYEVWKKAAGK